MKFKESVPTLLKLGLNESCLPQINEYIELLWAANEDLNLFSRQMPFKDLIDNHLVDCLLPLQYFPKDVKQVADFGSGGGMPGVIYAIQFPDVKFHLYEKSKKKQDFLNRCVAIAPNLKIHGDIPNRLENIDLVMARAFKPVDVILEMSRDHFEKKGHYFLLKGRKEKIAEEIELARKKFKSLEPKVVDLKSPVLEVERHLILI